MLNHSGSYRSTRAPTGQGYGQGGYASPQSGYNQGAYGQSGPPPPQYGHGHPRAQSYGPPAGADPMLWSWFSNVDVDRSGSISAQELQTALRNGNQTNFDIDTIKMLMNIFDTDRSGTIGFNEFAGLYKYIGDWQNVFRHFDRDQSNSIDGNELADALRNFGYSLSPRLLQLIEQKYAAPPADHYGGPPPGISFDRFVRACCAVKQLTESFQKYDTDRDGWIRLDYDSFMRIVLSAP